MARSASPNLAPLLSLEDVALGFDNDRLFEAVNLFVHPGERLCLVGRNGAGKSTFLRLIAGEIEPDEGKRVLGGATRIARLEQNPDFLPFERLIDYALLGVEEGEQHLVEASFHALGIPLDLRCETASGGEKRKAALAKILASRANLWLLDEPTNHLDIESIKWLENQIHARRDIAYILVSHDRRFLDALSEATLWLDRKALRRKNTGHSAFQQWRDQLYGEERGRWRREDKLIEEERAWAREGISARRSRNQGRLRRLEAMEEEAGKRIKHDRRAALQFADSEASGKLIVEIKAGEKSCAAQVFRNFNFKLTRGERIALTGPNGAGKTTLLRILLGEEKLDRGRFRQGLNLEVAYFDQARERFKPGATLAEALTDHELLSVAGREDQVMVRGQPRHIYAYLKSFLFSPDQIRSPVSTLSGGERARLILARIMAKPSNLLALDEPTNDLDVETLDLLEEVIDNYSGTVILVSHDRDFVDRIAERTIYLDGAGGHSIFAGGWSQVEKHLASLQNPANARGNEAGAKARKGEKKSSARKDQKDQRGQKEQIPPSENALPVNRAKESGPLSFTELDRAEKLPGVITVLEGKIAKLETLLADSQLYESNPVKFQKAAAMHNELNAELLECEEEWLRLEERRE